MEGQKYFVIFEKLLEGELVFARALNYSPNERLRECEVRVRDMMEFILQGISRMLRESKGEIPAEVIKEAVEAYSHLADIFWLLRTKFNQE